jgi:hypothetical protein
MTSKSAPAVGSSGLMARLSSVDLSALRRITVDPADLGEWIQDRWDAFSIKAQRESGTLPPVAPPMATEPLPMPNADRPTQVAELQSPDAPSSTIVTPRLKPALLTSDDSIDASEQIQTTSETPALRGVAMPQSHARAALPRTSSLPRLRNTLSQLDANTKGVRASLRRKLGIKRPTLKSLRIGTLEISAAALIMVLTAFFVIIGLAFLSPNRMSSGT